MWERNCADIHYELDYQGKTFKRHIDQIRSYEPPKRTYVHPPPTSKQCERRVHFYNSMNTSNQPEPPGNSENPVNTRSTPRISDIPNEQAPATPRRSSRTHHHPDWLRY